MAYNNPEYFSNEDSDKDYFQWMAENPGGYVVDPGKGKKRGMYIYHKPGCTHIASLTCSYKGKAKVCALDLAGLKKWFRAENIPINKARPCAMGCSKRNLPVSLG
jgi:hypothetical protein